MDQRKRQRSGRKRKYRKKEKNGKMRKTNKEGKQRKRKYGGIPPWGREDLERS